MNRLSPGFGATVSRFRAGISILPVFALFVLGCTAAFDGTVHVRTARVSPFAGLSFWYVVRQSGVPVGARAVFVVACPALAHQSEPLFDCEPLRPPPVLSMRRPFGSRWSRVDFSGFACCATTAGSLCSR